MLQPNSQTSEAEISESPTARLRRHAQAVVGHLSNVKMRELASLYDAANFAREAWNLAALQPRTGNGHISKIVDDEQHGLFYVLEAVAREIALRRLGPDDDDLERRRILADWRCLTGGDDDWE